MLAGYGSNKIVGTVRKFTEELKRGKFYMGKKITTGLLIGAIAGGIDLVPMLLQKLTWDANLSAFFLWVVTGFMVATSNLKINAALKGAVMALLCLLPGSFIIGWKEPLSLIPILIMTIVLGSLVGFIFHKLIRD